MLRLFRSWVGLSVRAGDPFGPPAPLIYVPRLAGHLLTPSVDNFLTCSSTWVRL